VYGLGIVLVNRSCFEDLKNFKMIFMISVYFLFSAFDRRLCGMVSDGYSRRAKKLQSMRQI